MIRNFHILRAEFKELAILGDKIEDNIFINPNLAITNSSLFAEKLLKLVAIKEKQEYLISLSQFERIKSLNNEGILDNNIVRCFEDIRIIGTKVVREGKNNIIEYLIKLHRKLYTITKWFVETYSSNYNVQVPLYSAPDFNKFKRDIKLVEIDNIIKQRPGEFIELSKDKTLVEEKGFERDYSIYTYKKLKGSYLLNELSKLRTSSQEAIESCESLNLFKAYLHVKRSIQDEFIELVEEANKSESSQLIILSGSVGDGKSHLLAYLNKNHNDIIKNFKIHNDATESFDPNLTEIETLAKVLSGFSDENIDNSKEKLILAINLGVLNNFLEEDFVKTKYKKFTRFINESGVFEQENISNGHKDNNFKLVSFGNYNIYELTNEGAKSSYIEELLNKIVEKDENNPFYKAYLKDIEEKFNSPTIINYKILSEPNVIKRITNLVIEAMVKYKKIIGTRELLNFIYEILVPANIEKFDVASSSIDYIRYLLPNLLFNSVERGMLLNIIAKEDILKLRSEKIDELLIKLNTSSRINVVLNEYLEGRSLEILDYIMGDIESINSLTNIVKQDLVDTILRTLYLIGNREIMKVFDDNIFNEFMIYLYYFNLGQPKNYKNLFIEVKQAIFNWNGSLKDNYIYLNEQLQNFKVSEKLELKLSKNGACKEISKEILERFKTTINIAFEVKSRCKYEILELDYELYKKVKDINNGYCASKNDREDALIFVEFIEKLIGLGNMENELLIEDKRDKKVFKLTYENDFSEEFKFERID